MVNVGLCMSSNGGRTKEDMLDHPPCMTMKSVGFYDMPTCHDGETLVDKVDGLEGGECG